MHVQEYDIIVQYALTHSALYAYIDHSFFLTPVLFLFLESCSCANGGTCLNSTYACPTGFTDSNISTIANNCIPQPCQNGGTCTNAINSYTCTCPPGYTGRNCSTAINCCIPQPCTNGGTCVNGIGNFTCLCPSTHRGSVCSTRKLSLLAIHVCSHSLIWCKVV